MDSNKPDSREFAASWRSTMGSVALLFMLMAVVFGVLSVGTLRSGSSWLFMSFTLLLGWLAWWMGRQVRGTRSTLRVGPQGLEAYALNGQILPWRDVADVRSMSVQGQTHLVVTLVPGAAGAGKAPWLGGKKNERVLTLGAFKTKVHATVVAAVVEAFALYGGEQAAKAVQVQHEEARVVAAFEARLKALTPTTWALYLMVFLNVGVWLANVVTGVSAFQPATADLLRWGANSAASVVEDHEYVRLLTAAFLHGGFLHLALNMVGLWEAGKQLNRLHGNVQFLVIYLGSALVGSALSLHFSAQQAVSVGASGAVFGVLGALLVTMVQHRGQIPSLTSKNVMTSQGIFLAYALVQGFTKQGIDNAAHVGGLVAGAVLAWLLVEKLDDQAPPAKRQRALAMGVMASVLGVVGLVVSTPQPTVHHRQLFEFQATLSKLLPTVEATNKALQTDGKAAQAGTLTEADFMRRLETLHLPVFRQAADTLAQVDVPANDTSAAYVQDVKSSYRLTVEMMQLELHRAQRPESDTPETQVKLAAIQSELKLVRERLVARNAANKPKQPG